MRTRKKKNDHVDQYDEGSLLGAAHAEEEFDAEPPKLNSQGLDNFSKLDLFALLASTAVARKMDDPARIAHESYAIAKEMMKLSNLFAEVKGL